MNSYQLDKEMKLRKVVGKLHEALFYLTEDKERPYPPPLSESGKYETQKEELKQLLKAILK